ncbi:MAG: hypothetical protein Q7P63_16320 [Verrucomicrobiota bacterium JB022]|nr:hypothetical protein [Verrucomicrobiota bacterium JB022]
MERFRDPSDGQEKPLTEAQKTAIAEVDRKIQARLAELDIMRQKKLANARAQRDIASIQETDEHWRRDRKALEAEREAEKDRIRRN